MILCQQDSGKTVFTFMVAYSLWFFLILTFEQIIILNKYCTFELPNLFPK